MLFSYSGVNTINQSSNDTKATPWHLRRRCESILRPLCTPGHQLKVLCSNIHCIGFMFLMLILLSWDDLVMCWKHWAVLEKSSVNFAFCRSPCRSHFRTTKGWGVKVMHYTNGLRGVQLLLKHHARAEKVSGHRDQAMRRLLFIAWLRFNQSCQAPSSTRMCTQTPNRILRRARWNFIGAYAAGDSCGGL